MIKVATFDFDGTLTRHDSLWMFMRFSQGKTKLAAGLALFAPVYLLYRAGGMSNHRAKEVFFSLFFKGWTLQKFDGYCRLFSESMEKNIRREVMDMLLEHRDRGDMVFIVSASFENWIKPWAETLGIEVLATQADVDVNGKLTGKLKSPNCYGAEKVKRLEAVLPDRKEYYIYAYGNSRGDREMIDYADEGRYV
ncbi:MAG: HAD-IB family hydrolase [Dysgonamonadaceae bacterium]|jgi:HAD superfamily hydrolase (TIGR01490 family)|nr:HAD-IB family hydrolase [Dysgonamonadaceae bacterium]